MVARADGEIPSAAVDYRFQYVSRTPYRGLLRHASVILVDHFFTTGRAGAQVAFDATQIAFRRQLACGTCLTGRTSGHLGGHTQEQNERNCVEHPVT